MPAALLENSQNSNPIVTSASLHTLLTATAYSPLSHMGLIRVTGDDRVRWLNGMVTNSIVALSEGQGCYCFFLNAQGRIQGDATAWLFHDSILLETGVERIPGLLDFLERFIIMDDVELHPVDGYSGIVLAGPESASILSRLGMSKSVTSPLSVTQCTFESSAVDVMFAHSPLVPRIELWAPSETVQRIANRLDSVISQALPAETECLRLLEGTPLYGTDIRDRELPQETGQNRALHFSKGCYLGQEIVERIRSRGSVHRTFSGFQLAGPLPERGAPLFLADALDRSIGELTSAATLDLPTGPQTFALGYIRREAVGRGDAITYPGGTARPSAVPFRQAAERLGFTPLPDSCN